MSAEKKYQIIPRKYRPQTFASVVGQDPIVATLKNALALQRLAHAYLFCGSRGTGKTTLARLFAKALNCKKLSDSQEPCNQCPSCLEIASGKSLDVLEIDGASSRGIDDIRQINETIGYAPASGKYKIYIIDEVHMLTKEAFNALLKTLEEPPANVKFFFATTEPHKVLPTIVSRCQRFDLHRISPEVMQKKLASIAKDLQVEIAEDALALVVQAADGSLRDAESLLDQIICYAKSPISQQDVASALGLLPKDAFFALDEAINTGDLPFAFRLSGEIFSTGKDIPYFLEGLLEHYRILLLFLLGTPPAALPEKGRFQKSAALYTQEHCLYILDFLMHWVQQIGKNPFKRISLEMILLHLIRSKHRVSLPSLVKRLAELEKNLGEPDLTASSPQKNPAFAAPCDEGKRPASIRQEEPKMQGEQLPEEKPTLLKNAAPKIVPAAEKDISPPSSPELQPQLQEDRSPPIKQETTTLPEEQKDSQEEEIASLPSMPEAKQQPLPANREPAKTDPVMAASPERAQDLFEEETDPALGWDEQEAVHQEDEPTFTEATIEEASAAPKEPPSKERTLFEEPSMPMPQAKKKNPAKEQSKLDTLIRFAAVELEGIVKND